MEVTHGAGERDSRSLYAIVGALLVAAAVADFGAAGAVHAQPGNPKTNSPTVLFMCPHGAAKSVLASAYFRRVAKERGLNVRVVFAGTEPDARVTRRS